MEKIEADILRYTNQLNALNAEIQSFKDNKNVGRKLEDFKQLLSNRTNLNMILTKLNTEKRKLEEKNKKELDEKIKRKLEEKNKKELGEKLNQLKKAISAEEIKLEIEKQHSIGKKDAEILWKKNYMMHYTNDKYLINGLIKENPYNRKEYINHFLNGTLLQFINEHFKHLFPKVQRVQFGDVVPPEFSPENPEPENPEEEIYPIPHHRSISEFGMSSKQTIRSEDVKNNIDKLLEKISILDDSKYQLLKSKIDDLNISGKIDIETSDELMKNIDKKYRETNISTIQKPRNFDLYENIKIPSKKKRFVK